MNKPLSFADVSMLALAVGILKDRDVWSVYVSGGGMPQVNVDREALAGAIQDTGATPGFAYLQSHGNWKVSIDYGGMKLSTLANDVELRLFGYQADRANYPPQVVPLVREAVRA